MNTKTKTFIFFAFLFSFSLTSDLNTFEINPNERNTLPKKELSEIEKKSIESVEIIIGSSAPVFSLKYSGYLTISTIKNVIIYPFSSVEKNLNVFFKDGYMLLKDDNEMILWYNKFYSEEIQEIAAITFINRGTLVLKDGNNERIWPFSQEELNKKVNLNVFKGNLKLTDENQREIWVFSNDVKKEQKQNKNLKSEIEYLAI